MRDSTFIITPHSNKGTAVQCQERNLRLSSVNSHWLCGGEGYESAFPFETRVSAMYIPDVNHWNIFMLISSQ